MIFGWSPDNTLQIGSKSWCFIQNYTSRYILSRKKRTVDSYWRFSGIFDSIEALEDYIVDEVFDERQNLVKLAIEEYELKYGAE